MSDKTPEESLLEVMERLGAPKHLISMKLSISAQHLATVSCTYHPVDAEGHILHASNNSAKPVFEILADNFVLVPRRLYDLMPPSFVVACVIGRRAPTDFNREAIQRMMYAELTPTTEKP